MSMFGRIRTRYPSRAGMAGYATTFLGILTQSFSLLCLYSIYRYGGLIPGLYYLGWVLFPEVSYIIIQGILFAFLSWLGIFLVYIFCSATILFYLLNIACVLVVVDKYGMDGQTFMHRGVVLPLFFMVAITPGLPFQIRLLRDPWWKSWLPEPAQRP